jgi:hypothetical protein
MFNFEKLDVWQALAQNQTRTLFLRSLLRRRERSDLAAE